MTMVDFIGRRVIRRPHVSEIRTSSKDLDVSFSVSSILLHWSITGATRAVEQDIMNGTAGLPEISSRAKLAGRARSRSSRHRVLNPNALAELLIVWLGSLAGYTKQLRPAFPDAEFAFSSTGTRGCQPFRSVIRRRHPGHELRLYSSCLFGSL